MNAEWQRACPRSGSPQFGRSVTAARRTLVAFGVFSEQLLELGQTSAARQLELLQPLLGDRDVPAHLADEARVRRLLRDQVLEFGEPRPELGALDLSEVGIHVRLDADTAGQRHHFCESTASIPASPWLGTSVTRGICRRGAVPVQPSMMEVGIRGDPPLVGGEATNPRSRTREGS